MMQYAAMQLANQAIVILMYFVAFSLILGGFKGGKWAINLIMTPIRMILGRIEQRVQSIVTILVFTILIGYGVIHWITAIITLK